MDFSRDRALAYAHRWAFGRNPAGNFAEKYRADSAISPEPGLRRVGRQSGAHAPLVDIIPRPVCRPVHISLSYPQFAQVYTQGFWAVQTVSPPEIRGLCPQSGKNFGVFHSLCRKPCPGLFKNAVMGFRQKRRRPAAGICLLSGGKHMDECGKI